MTHRLGITGSMAAAVLVCAASGWIQAPSVKPATPAEAAQVLDQRALPLLGGDAAQEVSRTLAQLSYETKAGVKMAFDHHQQALQAAKWVELDGTQVTDDYASAVFTNGPYRLSLSVTPSYDPSKKGVVNIRVIQHGNIDTSALPVPAGAKPFYKTNVDTAYLAEGAVEDTRAQVRALLLQAGWEPYGSAGDVEDFKQNAVKLSARVAEAPAQAGKTLINYATVLMSADLPTPADALRMQYSETPTQISVDLKGSLADAAATYRKALGERGWKPTTEQPIQERFEQFWIFRNPSKDYIEIKLRDVDGIARLLIRYRTNAELEEQEQKQPR